MASEQIRVVCADLPFQVLSYTIVVHSLTQVESLAFLVTLLVVGLQHLIPILHIRVGGYRNSNL
jgi:hypothetical protein